MTREQSNPTIRGIIVLFIIAVVCVALLAILNDLLYVPPDTSKFNEAAEGVYDADIPIKKSVKLSTGKILVVAEGTLTDGTQVVGFYVTANKNGKSDVFELVVIIDRATDKVIKVLEVLDGHTGSNDYAYDESKLDVLIGVTVPENNAFDRSSIITTGATNSSDTVYNGLTAVAQYYNATYRGGADR